MLKPTNHHVLNHTLLLHHQWPTQSYSLVPLSAQNPLPVSSFEPKYEGLARPNPKPKAWQWLPQSELKLSPPSSSAAEGSEEPCRTWATARICSSREGSPCRLISMVPSWSAPGMMISRLFLRPLQDPDGTNGMLEPWLQSKGLDDADQVLAYFAVSKLGEPPVDGKTDTNPEGLTAAYGKWANAVAERLLAGGLSCKVLSIEEFQKQMLEKLIWISAFMLVGARHPGATVGVVEKEYRSEVSSLISELASAAAAEKKLEFEGALEERLCAYSRAVAHFPTAVKEFKWRNGWFYSLSEKAIADGKPDPCPLHTAWLKELKII